MIQGQLWEQSSGAVVRFSGSRFGDLPAKDRDVADYELACQACEIPVRLETASELQEIVSALSYTLSGKPAKGRVLMRDAPSYNLRRGDRLEPSKALINPNLLEFVQLPVTVYFWRCHFDSKKRNVDWLSHRSPLFGERTGIHPHLHLTVDSLHTVYLGTMQRWTSAAIHRILQGNPWKQAPHMRLKMLVDEFKAWQRDENILSNRRISTLTPKMIGDDMPVPHPGCNLKLKGAETRVALAFCINTVRRYIDVVPLGRPLLLAGEAMAQWLLVQDSAKLRMTPMEYQHLVDASVRHRSLCFEAQVGCLPKHHSFAHLSVRTALSCALCLEALPMQPPTQIATARRARANGQRKVLMVTFGLAVGLSGQAPLSTGLCWVTHGSKPRTCG